MPVVSHFLRVSSLPAHYPVVEWSDDNHASITCEDGSRIMSPNAATSISSSETLTWDSSFIAAEVYNSDKDVGVDREKVYEKATTEHNLLLTLDQAVTCTQTNNVGTPKPAHHRFAKWSPLDVDQLSRCILATIDLNHNLSIWVRHKQNSSLNKTDLSSMLLENVMKRNFSDVSNKNESEFESLKSRSYFLAAQQICWSHKFSTEMRQSVSWVYLFQMTKTSHIIIWKVHCGSCNAEIVTTIKTDLKTGTAMHWCKLNSEQGYLVIGDSDGLVKAYLYTQERKGLASSHQFLLWEENDLIQPKYLNWCKEGRVVVYAKGPHLIAQKLSTSDGKPDIAGFNLSLGGSVPISGISLRNLGEVFVAIANGQNISVHLDVESGVPSLVKHLGQVDHDDIEKCKNHGVCYSRNGALLLSAHSPSIMFDHLSMRKPLKIILQSCVELNEACKAVLERGNLYDSWDFLLIIKEGVRQELPLAALVEINFTQKEKWPGKSVIWLKLMRYIRLLQQSYKCLINSRSKEKKDTPEQDSLQIDIELLSFLILKAYSVSLLEEMKDSQSDKVFQVRKCLSCINESSTCTLSNSEQELCVICGEPARFTSVLHGSCKNGHTFGRCCQTLLLCQDVSYRKCSMCNSLALGFQDSDLQQFQSHICVLCDGILI